VDDVLAAGEGIETVLSLRQALHFLPAIAALSAAHLAAVRLRRPAAASMCFATVIPQVKAHALDYATGRGRSGSRR
jgi:hypothetical protein